jgi:hypothetical protein
MMEKFEKTGKQGAGIEEILKQLLDESVSNSLSMAQMEESMRELKMVAGGSLKRIETVETPPPPHRRHRRVPTLRQWGRWA